MDQWGTEMGSGSLELGCALFKIVRYKNYIFVIAGRRCAITCFLKKVIQCFVSMRLDATFL